METPSQTLHRLTSYRPPWSDWENPPEDPRAVRDFQTNDVERLPFFYKQYSDDLPRIPLPRELQQTTASTVAVLAGVANVERREIDLAHLSRLLHLSAGVVRTTERPYATWLFRAAGSAGGRFPLELYVSVPDGESLPAGVHWYDPKDHALVTVGPAPRGEHPALVVTGVPWRTGWRYRERGYRHVYWDAGTMLAQLLAAADSAGLSAHLHSRFPDAEVTELVGADGVHEWPVAVVALGDGPPALESSGPAATGEVDADPIEFPLVTEAQRAGDVDELGRPWNRGAPAEAIGTAGDPVETVVLARGSQRRLDPTRGLSAALLQISMTAAVRGIDLPQRIVVNDVEGLAPGVYRWPDLSAPARPGLLRDELYRVCMDQALPHDAAFVVITAADVSSLDDREYREAQLASGIVEGRLHLLAYAQGAAASGMTFLDSEIPALLDESLDALLFTCVGVPEYQSTAGGLPGAPKAIRQVSTKDD